MNDTKDYINRSVLNRKLGVDAPRNRYIFEDFRGLFTIAAQGGGAAAGATGTRNILTFGHNRFEQFVLGAGQTIFNPPLTAVGLDIAGDLTATEGFEYTAGIELRQETIFTAQQEGPFMVEAEFTVADASGINPLYVGFRRQQAYQATFANYTDFAAIGINGTVNPNTIQTQTQLNTAGGATTNTGLTWADGVKRKLKLICDGGGKVTYFVDGAPAPNAVPFTFDTGDLIIPFVRILQAVDLSEVLAWSSFECGMMVEATEL